MSSTNALQIAVLPGYGIGIEVMEPCLELLKLVENRIDGVFHRIVPGQTFLVDGEPGPTGNLHMGIYLSKNARPHPNPEPPEPTRMHDGGRHPRAWILISDDDSFERILAATRHCTTILVSHRLSTVRLVDRIAVIEHGRVVEVGSHDELIALGGRYRTMFELQASRFAEVDDDGREVAHDSLA